MKKIYYLFVFMFISVSSIWISCQESAEKVYTVQISTPLGDMKAILYNETPIHRDNFIKLVKEGFYDGTLFHRCIQDFMIQGGDPTSKDAAPGDLLGAGDMGYTLEPEFGKIHKKGALSAARMGDQMNPEKRSSGSQFFIVHGIPVNADILNYFTNQTGRVYTAEEVDYYSTIGGRPDLDMNYTVFGEIIEGLEVIEKILALPTDPNDRPFRDMPMQVKIIN